MPGNPPLPIPESNPVKAPAVITIIGGDGNNGVAI